MDDGRHHDDEDEDHDLDHIHDENDQDDEYDDCDHVSFDDGKITTNLERLTYPSLSLSSYDS